METIISQIDLLLSTSPGVIALQFIAVLISLMILQDNLIQRKRVPGSSADKKIGLAFTLAIIRILFFIISGIAWTGSANLSGIVPVLSRTVDIATLILIIWIVQFSDSSNLMKNALRGVLALILIMGVSLEILWITQQQTTPDAQPILFKLFEGFGLFIALIGLIRCFATRKSLWPLEMLVYGLPFAAYLWYLVFQLEFFPLNVLLANLISMLLFLFWSRQQVVDLPLVLPAAQATGKQRVRQALEGSEDLMNLDTIDDLLKEFNMEGKLVPAELAKGQLAFNDQEIDLLVTNILSFEESGTSQGLTTLLGKYLKADHCMMLTFNSDKTALEISGYYSKEGLAPDTDLPLTSVELPDTFSNLKTGQSVVMPARSTSKDRRTLRKVLKGDLQGSIYLLPVSSGSEQSGAFMLHSADMDRDWTEQEKSLLQKLGPAISEGLVHIRDAQIVDRIEDRMQQEINTLSQQQLKEQAEKEEALKALNELQLAYDSLQESFESAEKDTKSEIPEILRHQYNILESAYKEIQKEVDELKEENAALQEIDPGLTEELEKAKLDLQDKTEKIEELEQAYQNLEAQKSGLESKIEALESSSQELAQTDEELENSKSQLAQANQELEALKTQLTQANEDLVSARTQAEETAKELENRNNEYKLAMAELSSVRQSLQDSIEQVSEMKVQYSSQATSSADQSDVIASITQDLRQPLQSIMGYTDLLLEESAGIIGALQRKFLERVKTSTERMNSSLKDLIKIITLESGDVELSPVLVNLPDIISKSVNDYSLQIREKDIQLKLDLEKDLPELRTDQDAVEQILNNLIANACMSTPSGGEMEIAARMQKEDPDGNFVLIQVRDSGGGIPTEDIPRVFSRLYRPDNPLIPGVGDTGVGLSIAKTLTEMLKGRIWVDSDMGVGSTFSVLLDASNGIGTQTDSLRPFDDEFFHFPGIILA